MKNSIIRLLLIPTILLSFGCDKSGNSQTPIYGTKSHGSIPSQIENKMYLGLSEKWAYDWMKESGVEWNARYMYLANGWIDNWGWSTDTGAMALNYMKECGEMNALPVLEFYIQTYIGDVGVSNFYEKATDPDIMYEFYNQYKVLIEKAVEYGKPVAILIEADGFAFLQIKSKSDPNLYAAIADSKVPELAGLPNILSSWGLAFLEIKKQLGADNVMLGMHIGAWAGGVDVSHQPTADIQEQVDKVYNFLAPFGLVPNQTGLEYDFLVGDPLDRDADYYRVEHNQDKWWDMSSTAEVNTVSFNRYAEWLRLWNEKSNKRWMLWQIPIGNEFNKNVFNTGKPQEGYKDNRVEYFLGDNSMDHLAKFADCGVFALLFGIGQSGQADYLNDYDDTGKLNLKTKGRDFYKRGDIILKR